jgi:SAM-dependent methyltransferase
MLTVVHERLRTIWSCPACGGELVGAGSDGWRCADCGVRYGLLGDVPNLVPPGKRPPGESDGDTEAMVRRRNSWDRRLGEEDTGLQRFIALATAHMPVGAVVADLGTGPATVPMVLARRRPRPALIVAMDISPAAVQLARQNTRALPNVQVLCASSRRRLPLRDASCDLVLRRLAPALPEEIWRILRPGSTYLRFTYGPEHWREVYDALPDVPRPTPRGARRQAEGEALFASVATERHQSVQRYTIHTIVDGLEMSPAAFFFNRARDLPRLRAALPPPDADGRHTITTDYVLVTTRR